MILPVHFQGDALVQVHLRAPRDGEVTAYLDEAVVARIKTNKSRFDTVRIELPAAKATQGEHLLRLRASGMAPLGRESVAIAIDWMSVTPLSAQAEAPRVSPLRASNPGELKVSAGTTVAYAFGA